MKTIASCGVVFAAILAIPTCIRCVPPPTKPAKTVTAEDVYNELVAAHCLAPDDQGGIDFIAAEHTLPDESPYFKCLWAGGTISSCKVPCK